MCVYIEFYALCKMKKLICEMKYRVHTEVVISSQPRWLSHVDGSCSKPSHEVIQTLFSLIFVCRFKTRYYNSLAN